MNRILLGLSTCVLGLGVVGTVSAHEPSHRGHDRYVHTRPYHQDHGRLFPGGYYYPGENHHHWEHRIWDSGCHRYHYYDPYLRCYYYWNPELLGYYPVGY